MQQEEEEEEGRSAGWSSDRSSKETNIETHTLNRRTDRQRGL
jgi:hypothetical protein